MPTIGYGGFGSVGSTIIGGGSQGNAGQGSGRVRRQTGISSGGSAAGTALTSAVGTAAAGTVDVTATPTQATINNNFATIVARLAAIETALRNAGVTL